ncbi:N-terminal acetyltransferase [Haplosporangium sp. Z 767]|nr:N-terminal acetyltransferase [Haplosporangium sp. Z 767]
MSVSDVGQYTREQIFSILCRINYPLVTPETLPEPTVETLRELQYRCVTSIPFETLSLRLTESREVDITAQGAYNRVVNQHRGGFCYSLNRFAFELLRGIGYTVQFTLARVCKPVNHGDPLRIRGLTHRVSIIRFEDGSKYLFDIGFGNTSFYPLEMKEGATIEFFGHKRRMVKTVHNQAEPEILGNPPEELWCLEEYMGEDKWVPCYVFSEKQFYEVDCEIANFFSCFSPQSPFISQFRCIQGTLDGKYYLLMGNEFKIRDASGTQKRIVLEKEQDRLDVLATYFGIVLTEDELKYHDQKLE